MTFHYPRHGNKPDYNRHLLIDFGSSSPPKNALKEQMLSVARDIAKRCVEKLDAVIVTHRHLDHLSGFARRKDKNGSGDIIRALHPDIVVQPWTEDPQAQTNALGPTPKNDPGLSIIRAMNNMQAFAGAVVQQLPRLKGKAGAKRLADIAFLGEQNLSNANAVENLMTMGKKIPMYIMEVKPDWRKCFQA